MERCTVIHWFRKGLRTHDNPALTQAIKHAKENKHFLRPIFILDPLIVQWLRVGPNRWRFLQQSLFNLNERLAEINTRLYVVRGKPEEVFKRIFTEWNVKFLTFELDIEPYSKQRDKIVEELAKQSRVGVKQCISHTLYDTEVVIRKNNGKPPLTYQKFLAVADSLGKIKEPLPVPENVPDFCTPPPDSLERDNKNCYEPPTLFELRVDVEKLGENLYPGGESEALNRLCKVLQNKTWICKFEKPNTAPNSIKPSTTVLSPYLKFGCLSARYFYHKLKEVIGNSPHTKPPVSLIGQLMWREFYYVVGAVTPNFDRMVGNPICCQIPWDTNDIYLKAWSEGRTGYPFIDAIMRQLRQEGWIHHLARHAVACFLTRGDLWISWEEGQKVFEELLLDADWALNAGNWMWLSASAFFHQFYRVYSPVAFGKKTDKSGEYIRKYVQELKNYPEQYIYEPWNAPKNVQRGAECVVGEDYPERIVIHEEVYKVNIGRMSLAYKKNKEKVASEASGGKSKENGLKRKRDVSQMTITKFVKRNCK